MEDKAGFKKLNAWQSAYVLTLDVYKVTKSFPKSEVYGLTSQLRRAVVSVPANIAEGYERNHRREYVQFLSIAKGSLVTKGSNSTQNGKNIFTAKTPPINSFEGRRGTRRKP